MSAIVTRMELLRRVRNLVFDVLEGSRYTPPQEVCAELFQLENEIRRAQELLARDIDNLMAGRYQKYNTKPPAYDIHGLSGNWGGWTAERERVR